MNGHVSSLFTLILIGASLLTAALASWSMYHRIRGSYAFTMLMLALGWWSCAYAQELGSPELPTAIVWGKLQYLAIVGIPPLWLIFGLRYSGRGPAAHPWNRLALAVIPAITLLLVWTNEAHGLIWARVEQGSLGALRPLSVEHGPWFWVHTIYSYNLVIAGNVFLLAAAWRAAPFYRRQAFGLVAGAVIPLLGNIHYLSRLTPFAGLDLTPLLFTCSGLLFAWANYSTHLMTVGPVARNRLMEEMTDVVLVLDDQGRVADLNPPGRLLLGGRHVFGRRLSAAAASLAAQLDAGVGELTVDDGGILRTYDVQRKLLLQGWLGAPSGVLIVLRDITERKRAERELRAQKELFAALLALAQAAAAGPTLRETLQSVIVVVCELTGSTRGSIFLFAANTAVVQSIVAHGSGHPDTDPAVINEVLTRGLAGWAVRNREVVIVSDTAADPRWVRLEAQQYDVGSALAVPVVEGEHILGVITLSHSVPNFFQAEHVQLMSAAAAQIGLAVRNAQMYETQRELAEQAEAASRTKSTFLATVSHELRTPLNIIIGYSEILAEGLKSRRPVGTREIQHISEAAYQLLALVNDLIELSRVEAGATELTLGPVDLSALVFNVASIARPLAAQNANILHIDAPDDLGVVISDLAKLRRILLHLLSNACKFTQGGSILLVARRHQPGHDAEEWLTFEVVDTGIGIAEGLQAEIFAPFTQADGSSTRRYGGMGVGLGLSRQLAQLLGGEITVQSRPGEGATFIMNLPVTADNRPVVEASVGGG